MIVRRTSVETAASESMRLRDAIDMLADSRVGALGPTIWADLGCGDGTFTRALADILAAGSLIHAIDVDAAALRSIPAVHKAVRISTYCGDFMTQPWPFTGLDGILMGNSLHYVQDQAAFIRQCESHMKLPPRFLLVEYDSSEANCWIPYPVGLTRSTALFERAGYSSVRVLRSRPSRYQHAPLYSVAVGLP